MPHFRRTLLALLFVLSCLVSARSQDSTMAVVRSFGIGTGFAYSALKNEKFSPLTHTGSGLPVQAYYRNWKPTRQLHFQLFYSSLSLSSEFGTLVTREKSTYFQYGSHYRFGKGQKRITTWGGFVMDGQMAQRTFSSTLGSGTVGNNSSDEGFISLNPSVLFENKIGNDKLSLQVWTSLVAYVILPKDGGSAEGKLASFGSFTKTEARLSYSKYFSRHWEGRIDGQFQYYALSVAQPVYKINTQAIASIAYKL